VRGSYQALLFGSILSAAHAAPDAVAVWLEELPHAPAVLAIYGGADVQAYARQAAAFAVLVDYIEIVSGVD
jgi:hypothetical protein